jgi:hypothetical protein
MAILGDVTDHRSRCISEWSGLFIPTTRDHPEGCYALSQFGAAAYRERLLAQF